MEKEKLDCAFVGYNKAFDTVWRQGLWFKIMKESIDGKLILLVAIKSMYSSIQYCVLILLMAAITFVLQLSRSEKG